MQFTNNEFNQFRKDVKDALKEVEEKYQISIEAGSISYSDKRFSMKLEATKNGCDIRKEEFEQACRFYGFEPDDYMREFFMNGEVYMLTGFNRRAKKNPCRITKKDGLEYRCGIDLVKAMFDMQKAI